jgi:hypothetical protein
MAAVTVPAVWLANLMLPTPGQVGDGQPLVIRLGVILGPVAAGTCALAALVPALPQAEATAARPLWRVRLAHVVAVLGLGALLVGVGALPLHGEATWSSAVRNYLWFVGFGLAAQAVVPAMWCWVAPLAWIAWLLTGSLIGASGYPWYNVISQPDHTASATWQAAVVLVLGLTVAVHGGRRPRHSDAT